MQYSLFHLAHDGDLTGLVEGAPLFSVTGCFDLSNPISVTMNEVVGGRLLTNTSADVVEYCAGQSDDLLLTDLSGSRGTQVLYVLTDFQRNIIEIFPTSSIDLSTLSSGGFFLTAVSFAGPLEGLTGGSEPE